MSSNPQQKNEAAGDDPRNAIESGEPTIDEAGAHAQAGHTESADEKKKTDPDGDRAQHWESGRQQAL